MATEVKKSRWSRFIDGFTSFSVKLGNQVHLRSLRDSFATIMPMFILAGMGVLINNVIFPWILHGNMLLKFQAFGSVITNGTLNIASILIAPMIAYFLAKNKGFHNPIGAVAVSISALFIMMALHYSVVPTGAKKAVDITGAVLYTQLGTTSMFAGIITGLVATELFMAFSKSKKLVINLGDQVPPAVGQSFASLLPSAFTLIIFALVSAILISGFNTDLITLISQIVQEPLRRVNTSLLGFLLIYSTGNFLFTLGIHQSVINGSLLDPFLIMNINQNMQEVSAGHAPTNIINVDFTTVYSQMGGTGMCLAAVLAALIFSKFKPYRDVSKLALAPSLFEISEPVIFGFPVVFNIPLMIPFVLSPVIGSLIGYFVTVIGLVKPLSVMVPWTTPPLLSGFLASQGDYKVVLVQLFILVLTTLFYVPFLRVAAHVNEQQVAAQNN
ncbi:PTS sugar transporter subunit IIC [Lacticaseibacillus jixianensis]|uniref:Permease IIC component n=1 Tax=Lacticaseibacillus jixianensis TaxID=2486012 RepID=A0ABW4BCL5_9LACO|nr:PTS transporter subunit EIIC [Lacticaseibacillus jixianensis]